jgi:polysaccharide biosynthesis protein PelG
MAGIGFVLRKLASRDDYLGITRAFIHASIVSAGPWLMTVLSLGIIYFFTEKIVPFDEASAFRTVMIYNFSFSLVLSSPVYMVTTRFVSDELYKKDIHTLPGVLICSIGLLFLYSFPIAAMFFFGIASLPSFLAIQAILNFLLLSMLWIAMLFFSAVKNYQSLSLSFFLGIIIATLVTIFLAFPFGAQGMLAGFNIGISFIVFSLFGVLFAEYPYRFRIPFAYFPYFRRYWKLALSGILYNAGIWIDKWLMWFSPDATLSPLGIYTFPTYDTAMFIAFLTIIPVMALFVFSLETNFFETYLTYFRSLQQNASFHSLKEKQNAILKKILENGRNFIILQGSISLLFILLAPTLFEVLQLSYLQLGIFRLGVLGAFFNALVLFVMIFLAYFDSRENYLRISAILFFSNFIFSWISMKMGFVFYGYGYFFAMACTFLISASMLINYTKNLSYQIFVTNNVKRLPVTQPVEKREEKL